MTERAASENRTTTNQMEVDSYPDEARLMRLLSPMMNELAMLNSKIEQLANESRGRTQSRMEPLKRNESRPRPQVQVKTNEKVLTKTFAEIVNLSKTKKDCIRNIKITSEEPEQIELIRKNLAKTHMDVDL